MYVDRREEIHSVYICWENTRCNVFVTCVRRLLAAGEVTAVTHLRRSSISSLVRLEVIKTRLLLICSS